MDLSNATHLRNPCVLLVVLAAVLVFRSGRAVRVQRCLRDFSSVMCVPSLFDDWTKMTDARTSFALDEVTEQAQAHAAALLDERPLTPEEDRRCAVICPR